jgi:Protein of unknown function (DUF3237)
MEIVHEFTFHAVLGEFLPTGGPFGDRSVIEVKDGWVKGDRVTGRLVGPAADWLIGGADGYSQIDVRGQIRTDDGANLYIHYVGSVHVTEAAAAALFSDGETNFGDNYFYTHVRLESGAEQYQWVNRAMFVGQGRVASDGVEYEIYRLV